MAPNKRALSRTEAELFVTKRRRVTRLPSASAAAAAGAPPAPPVAISPAAAEPLCKPGVAASSSAEKASLATVLPFPAADELSPLQIAPSPAAAAAEARPAQIPPSAAAAAADATPSPRTLSPSASRNGAVPASDSISDLSSAAASSDIVKGSPPEFSAAAGAAGQERDGGRIGRLKWYRKIRDLGEGGFGVVSKARDTRTGEVVAVKSSKDPGGGAALLREAALLAACRGNPAVVGLREVVRGSGADDVHLVIDFVGDSLHDAIRRRRRSGRRFTESEVLGMMRELLTGVAVMQAQGIVHGDLKPDNILVDRRDGRLKICDFGLSSAVAAPPQNFEGTLWYSSPEQLLGEGNCGPAVDAWALGCVMAELLTGEPLVQGVQTAHQLTSIIYLLGVSDEVSQMDLGVGASARSELRDKVTEELLSAAGFEVLRGLLQFGAMERLTPAAALQMNWFNEGKPKL